MLANKELRLLTNTYIYLHQELRILNKYDLYGKDFPLYIYIHIHIYTYIYIYVIKTFSLSK